MTDKYTIHTVSITTIPKPFTSIPVVKYSIIDGYNSAKEHGVDIENGPRYSLIAYKYDNNDDLFAVVHPSYPTEIRYFKCVNKKITWSAYAIFSIVRHERTKLRCRDEDDYYIAFDTAKRIVRSVTEQAQAHPYVYLTKQSNTGSVVLSDNSSNYIECFNTGFVYKTSTSLVSYNNNFLRNIGIVVGTIPDGESIMFYTGFYWFPYHKRVYDAEKRARASAYAAAIAKKKADENAAAAAAAAAVLAKQTANAAPKQQICNNLAFPLPVVIHLSDFDEYYKSKLQDLPDDIYVSDINYDYDGERISFTHGDITIGFDDLTLIHKCLYRVSQVSQVSRVSRVSQVSRVSRVNIQHFSDRIEFNAFDDNHQQHQLDNFKIILSHVRTPTGGRASAPRLHAQRASSPVRSRRKHVDSNGVERVVYVKNGVSFIKKKRGNRFSYVRI